MRYFLTRHARMRMVERAITKQLLEESLRRPTAVLRDTEGRLLLKKLYRHKNARRLLLIVGVPTARGLKIITVIDTSKWRKYL